MPVGTTQQKGASNVLDLGGLHGLYNNLYVLGFKHFVLIGFEFTTSGKFMLLVYPLTGESDRNMK